MSSKEKVAAIEKGLSVHARRAQWLELASREAGALEFIIFADPNYKPPKIILAADRLHARVGGERVLAENLYEVEVPLSSWEDALDHPNSYASSGRVNTTAIDMRLRGVVTPAVD